MDHPVRTLLYELFVEPILRLLQRPSRGIGGMILVKEFALRVPVVAPESGLSSGGNSAIKDDRYQRSGLAQGSKRPRQSLRNNGSL
jgi:hypothetical protein